MGRHTHEWLTILYSNSEPSLSPYFFRSSLLNIDPLLSSFLFQYCIHISQTIYKYWLSIILIYYMIILMLCFRPTTYLNKYHFLLIRCQLHFFHDKSQAACSLLTIHFNSLWLNFCNHYWKDATLPSLIPLTSSPLVLFVLVRVAITGMSSAFISLPHSFHLTALTLPPRTCQSSSLPVPPPTQTLTQDSI